MLRTFLISLAALACLAGQASAQAQEQGGTITRYVSGTFDAPATGSFSGSYEVDSATDQVSAANIQVTAGAGNSGNQVPAGVYRFVTGQFGSLGFTAAASTPANGQRGAYISFNGGSTPSSGATAFFLDGQCANAGCTSQTSDRSGQANITNTQPPSPAAPVPTLSEWAMILFGTVLAGGAALYIQRRRLLA